MNYQSVNDTLTQLATGIDAAEAHGMATGMLSIASDAAASNWIQAIFGEELSQAETEHEELVALFEQTRKSLTAGFLDFDFDLLIPDDDESYSDQATALGLWCNGYLYGIGYYQANTPWPGELGEIMRDMIELTKIDCSDNDPDAEADLMEIREYVRVAVFMVRDFFWNVTPKSVIE